jgi:hypothetical protein
MKQIDTDLQEEEVLSHFLIGIIGDSMKHIMVGMDIIILQWAAVYSNMEEKF